MKKTRIHMLVGATWTEVRVDIGLCDEVSIVKFGGGVIQKQEPETRRVRHDMSGLFTVYSHPFD